ncbi:hypothetical protein [Flavobacterium sp. FlaQc-48]|uniref:hypothetical protein n=1 Tax=Flavobacterium sp. FlaQc-48 TaxID=3374181 RepID=UPI0037574B73
MKKVALLLGLVCSLTACQTDADKNYAILSGTLNHQSSDSLMIISQSKIIKTITVADDGTFSDSVKVKTGNYNLSDGSQHALIYLKNGYDLKIGADAANFNQSICFGGTGARINTYERMKEFLAEKIFDYVSGTLMFVYNLF